MMRRNLLLGLLLLVPLGIFAAWWFDTFERVEQDVPAPLRGEARYNPLFALKKVLQARGIDVAARADLNLQAMALGDDDTLIFGGDVRTLTEANVEDLLSWVDDGGHLIFSLPPGSEGRGGELVDTLGLSVVSNWTCLKWPLEGQAKNAESCFNVAFKLHAKKAKAEGVSAKDFDLLISASDKNGYVIGRRVREQGAWLVAADLDFLRNRELKEPGNSALAWQVLAPMLHGGKVHLVYAADVLPWHVLLVRYGWPALLPALLALCAWLWARSQRFGPLLPLAVPPRRALREHVRAAGEFVFRRGRAAALYAPLRRAFDARLQRDAPALAALDGEALVAALAKQRGHSIAEVRAALSPIGLARPEQFLTTIKTLQSLRLKT